MAKRFDIHEWQAQQQMKQWLREADDFTPDLEDDELKRSKIQQMMAKEKGGKEGPPYISATQLFDNIIKGLETSGPYQDDIMFSKERALEIMEMIIDIEESEISPEAALAQAMEKEDELDEQNTTGTGTSFNAGDGAGYATPNAFAKKGKHKHKNVVYEDEGASQPPADGQEPSTDSPEQQIEDIVDTAKELGDQLKSLGKEILTPKGGKGYDSGEIKVFSELLIQISDQIKNGNASSLLGRLKNIL